MTLPQRSPAPALHRPAAYGQLPQPRPAVRPVAAGARLQAGAPLAQRPVVQRPLTEQPAPRARVTFLTVTEVAAMMRVSKMTVYRLVHGGELAAVRVGRSFRVPAPAVRAYLDGARTDIA